MAGPTKRVRHYTQVVEDVNRLGYWKVRKSGIGVPFLLMAKLRVWRRTAPRENRITTWIKCQPKNVKPCIFIRVLTFHCTFPYVEDFWDVMRSHDVIYRAEVCRFTHYEPLNIMAVVDHLKPTTICIGVETLRDVHRKFAARSSVQDDPLASVVKVRIDQFRFFTKYYPHLNKTIEEVLQLAARTFASLKTCEFDCACEANALEIGRHVEESWVVQITNSNHIVCHRRPVAVRRRPPAASDSCEEWFAALCSLYDVM